MGLVAAERAEGSFGTLLALPERPWRILAVKLAVAALTILAPLVVGLFITLAMAGGRELAAKQIFNIYVTIGWSASTFFLWILAFTIGQPTEARVGLVGLGAGALWGLWPIVVDSLQSTFTSYRQRMDTWLWQSHPSGALTERSTAASPSQSPSFSVSSWLSFCVGYFNRFARLARRAR